MVSRSCLLKLAVVVIIALILVHFLLVPNIIGYYNEDCELSQTRYEAYRLLFQRIVTSYNKLNQTYWVDSGLLLGYYRTGDMLAHDGDIDLSRIHLAGKEKMFDDKFQPMMAAYPETLGNAIVAEMNYTGANGDRVYVTGDLMRMQITVSNEKKSVIPYWNKGHREDKRYQLFQKPFEATFPYEDIVPLQHHMFLGVNASFPNNIAAVLRRRYGRLYRIPIPYKWKCYLNTTSIMCLILLAIFLSSVIYYRKQRSR